MIVPLTLEMAVHIARRMRRSDVHEVMAVSPAPTIERWAGMIADAPGPAYAVLAPNDGEPVAMGGGVILPAHCAHTWFVGTDRLREGPVRVLAHRMALRAHKAFLRAGVHRMAATAWEKNRESRRWLLRLGYRQEGVHPMYGRDGETFVSYGRVA